jgi:hypothetical protein
MSDYGKILMSTANAVGASLKKKMGSLTGYAPVDWAETINKLGNKLPERTVSGAVCSFADGADDVPIKTATFNIAPTLDGVSAVNVTQQGKNLFNKADYTYIKAHMLGGTVTNSAGHTLIYMPCKPNTTYTVSRERTNSNERFAVAWSKVIPEDGITVYDMNRATDSGTVGDTMSVFVTTGSDAVYLVIGAWWSVSDATIAVNTMQVEVGSSATTYTAYTTPTTRTISLGQTVYGGSVTVDEDGECELTDGYEYIDFSQLTVSTIVRESNLFRITFSSAFYGSNRYEIGLCNNQMTFKSDYTVANNTDMSIAFNNAYGLQMIFRNDSLQNETDENIKAFVATLRAVYPKATPTQSTLDPVTPIQTKLGVNNIWCDTGDSEVTYYAQPNVPEEVLYKGQISSTSDYATANFTESVADDEEILVKVYCPARDAVDYKVIKVADIGNGLNVGFNLHTTVNCTITKTSIASYQYSGDYYDIYADVLAYDSAIFN